MGTMRKPLSGRECQRYVAIKGYLTNTNSISDDKRIIRNLLIKDF